jgi:hypothetical protein
MMEISFVVSSTARENHGLGGTPLALVLSARCMLRYDWP